MTGFEPLIVSSLTGIATQIFREDVNGPIGKLFSRDLSEDLRLAIFKASQRYVKRYTERHGILKVLGMQKPLDLESVYTGVRLLEHQGLKPFASAQSLEAAYRAQAQRSFQVSRTALSGIEVANQEQFLMIVGGPGAGKSTFLRRIGLEALKQAQGHYQHRVIPVFIELKQLGSPSFDLLAIITQELANCGFPRADEFTQRALKKGNLIILFDGLDEVPASNLGPVIEQIQNFVDRYDQNRYIASCRTAAYRSNFRRFTDVAMAEFDDSQIEAFIRHWFMAQGEKKLGLAQKCWEVLSRLEHKGARELAQTPLLLTFLCLVYDRSQHFPENRAMLYRKALRIMLEEWAAEKRIFQDKIYQGLDTDLEEILLAEIAYGAFEQGQLFFEQRDLVDRIQTFLMSNLNAPRRLSGEAVLEAIAVQQGIMIARAETVFSFSHLTLQEYLVAQHIVDNNLIDSLVETHLEDEQWREVFLLVAGLMRQGADALLLTMEQRVRALFQGDRLGQTLAWAEQLVQGSPSKDGLLEKQTEALALILALARARASTRAMVSARGSSLAEFRLYEHALDRANLRVNALAAVLLRGNVNASAGARIRARTRIRHSQGPDLCASARALVLDLDYVQELEIAQVFQGWPGRALLSQLREQREAFLETTLVGQRDKILRGAIALWLDSLAFPFGLEAFELEELRALSRFLEGVKFIAQCKQAAVRVSPDTWLALEARLLTMG